MEHYINRFFFKGIKHLVIILTSVVLMTTAITSCNIKRESTTSNKLGYAVAIGQNYHGQCEVSNLENVIAIDAGSCTTIALINDGTVRVMGWWNEYSSHDHSLWHDIVDVCAGEMHIVGLTSDGGVVASGWNSKTQCEVSDWRDIVAVDAGELHTVGLKSDGTVIATGSNKNGQCDVSNWTDIVAISAGGNFTIGVKSNGSVIATGSNNEGQCNVRKWHDIVAVSAGSYHAIGLMSDGTAVSTGYNGHGQCDISEWEGLVAIDTYETHTVGLKFDGKVVATGSNSYGQCNVESWHDIFAVAAGAGFTVALSEDRSMPTITDYVDTSEDIELISLTEEDEVFIEFYLNYLNVSNNNDLSSLENCSEEVIEYIANEIGKNRGHTYRLVYLYYDVNNTAFFIEGNKKIVIRSYLCRIMEENIEGPDSWTIVMEKNLLNGSWSIEAVKHQPEKHLKNKDLKRLDYGK